MGMGAGLHGEPGGEEEREPGAGAAQVRAWSDEGGAASDGTAC